MARNDGIDELDPRFPIDRNTAPCPEFWRSLRPWWSHSSAFAMAESERAGKQAAHREEVFIRATAPVGYVAGGRVYHPSDVTIVRKPLDDDLPAVEFVPRSRVYRELEPDALAAEYLAAPLEPLP